MAVRRPTVLVNGDISQMPSGDVLPHEVGGLEADISAITTGGILYGSGAGAVSILTAGTNGHVLTLASGVPSWAAASGGADARLLGPGRVTGSAQTISSTSAADVTGASISLAANDAGRARLMLLFTGPSTGTLDILWSYPTGFTGYWADANELYASYSFESNQIAESGTKNIDTSGFTVNALTFFDMHFINGANAGTLQLRAKRSTTGGTNATIRIGTQLDALIE